MPFAVYVKEKYIHNKVDHHIRQHSHADEAREFLMQKYQWSTTTIDSIDWETQRNIINKLPHALQRTSLCFIHHRFPTGKIQFDIKHRCPYCNQSPTAVTSHDHFLQCIQSGQRKNIRLKKISQFLSSQHTPPIIRKGIINNISKYYNNIAQNDCCLLNTDSEQEDKKTQSQPSITSQNTIG